MRNRKCLNVDVMQFAKRKEKTPKLIHETF